MKIKQATLHEIDVPMQQAYVSRYGVWRTRPAILVEVSDGSVGGWGEVSAYADPTYTHETIGTCWDILANVLLPRVLGKTFERPDEVPNAFADVRGWPMARNGIEEAVWDLSARLDGQGLFRSFGSGGRSVPVGLSIGFKENVEQLLARVQHAVDSGYQRVKIKIQPGWDLEPVQNIRKSFPDLVIWCDAHACYEDPLEDLWEKLEKLEVSLIEQPFRRHQWVRHKILQNSIGIPIALSESISDLATLYMAIEMEACGAINLKLPLVGGPTEALQILQTAYEDAIPVWCGGVLETDVGRANRLALASRTEFTLPTDLGPTDRYTDDAYAFPTFHMDNNGALVLPTQNDGNGLRIDADKLKAITVRSHTFEAK